MTSKWDWNISKTNDFYNLTKKSNDSEKLTDEEIHRLASYRLVFSTSMRFKNRLKYLSIIEKYIYNDWIDETNAKLLSEEFSLLWHKLHAIHKNNYNDLERIKLFQVTENYEKFYETIKKLQLAFDLYSDIYEFNDIIFEVYVELLIYCGREDELNH